MPKQIVSSRSPALLPPLWPPRRLWITLASLATAAVLVRAGFLEPIVGSIVDQAVRNIITLILAFSGLMSLLVWFLRESGHSKPLKQMVFGGLLGAVVVAAGTLRIERVSGAVDEPLLDLDWEARPPRELWRRPCGAGWSGFAVCDGHAVTLEQRGDEEVIACYAVADGTPEWVVPVRGRHETVLGGVGPRSTPTIRDGVVYATGATGWLHAIEGPTGKVLWRKNVLDDLGIDAAAHDAAVAWGRAGSPLVTETLVIVPGGGPLGGESGGAVSLAAYDRGTGARVWTGGDEQISYVSPMLVTYAGRDVVLTVHEASVAAHDPADGRRLWSFPWPGHSNSDATCSQPHVLADGRIFISKGYGIGAALFEPEPGVEPPRFRPTWSQSALLKTKFTNAVIHDGHAYGLSDGILECVRVADGKRMWKGGRYGQGQVLRVGGLLVVQAESGEIVLVACESEKHVVRGRLAALAGQTWNNPAISGDRLLVRNAEEAACYMLPLAAAPGKAE
jgi:outer membrane protein assembly factor BamB